MSERPVDEVWEVLEEMFGVVRTRSERGRRNRAVSELREAGATVLEIRQTYRYCQRQYTHFKELAICTNLTAATSVSHTETLPEMAARLREERGT